MSNSMHRSGFTLIEVLVSVAILAVVATGLFQISTNSKNNFAFLVQKAQFDRLSSIPIMHNDPKYHHSEKDLYEYLRDAYDIREDAIRKTLKKRKVLYTQEEYATFSPFAEEKERESGDEEESMQQSVMDMTLLFDKITISDKEHATYVYKLQKQ
jgi:prepilin-type N-terminal cleavage/methylation domain-containing protein